MGRLTDAERAQVKAAHDAAIRQDPTIVQKLEEARKALHDGMVKADPSVETILEKMTLPRGAKEAGAVPGVRKKAENGNVPVEQQAPQSQQRPPAINSPRRGAPSGMAALTEDERARIKGLRDRVAQDATVVAARNSKKAATTPEERRQADESLRKTVNDAMIRLDASIAPVLEKLRPTLPSPLP